MNAKRKATWMILCLLMVIAPARAEVPASAQAGGDAVAPKLETLMSAVLEGVEGTEVILSRVVIPPNMELPKHWHPGEEFAYVLEGVVTLWQEGKPDTVVSAGGVAKIPLHQIHTARTAEEGATVLVFRVHERGKPERVPVE